jgi:two-component system, LytTR family, sensor kinase
MAAVRRPALWLAAFAGATLVSILGFWYRYLEDVVTGYHHTFGWRAIDELTGAVYGVPIVVATLLVGWFFPLDREHWRKSLPWHVCALVLFSAVHTSLNWGVRVVLYPLFGLGPYSYGAMPLRYLMEFPNDVIFYLINQVIVATFRYYRTMRDRELSLAQAELRNLRLQLQPHFLFNALNTISATMYDDPAAADAMIAELSELLRLSLRTVHTQEVPLKAELEALSHYTALMRARFGEKLSVAVDVEPAAADALVPSLILQPLVENAVRHGNVSLLGRGRIDVRARRNGDQLVIDVIDDGPGAPTPSAKGNGVGLSATAERLRLLYGDAHRFSAGNARVGGGFAVAIAIPFRPCAP